MTFTNDADLVARVAAAAVKATLAATGAAGGGGRLRVPAPPKTPTTPKMPVRPTRTASATAPAEVDRDRLAVAVHEAAHAVAGAGLGAELHTAILPPKGMLLPGRLKGQTFFRDHPHGTAELIAYAGPWAQAKFQAGGRRPTQREFFDLLNSTGCHDRRVLTAAGGTHEGAGVVPILDRCWDAVLTVARKLYNVGEAHRDDVLSALGITDGGGYYSSQLASLRSGCRSVPAFTSKTPQPA